MIPPDKQLPADLGFDWREQGDGELVIRRRGRPVTVLRGQQATKARQALAEASPAEAQQLLARLTGNYRRGNESQAALHPRNR